MVSQLSAKLLIDQCFGDCEVLSRYMIKISIHLSVGLTNIVGAQRYPRRPGFFDLHNPRTYGHPMKLLSQRFRVILLVVFCVGVAFLVGCQNGALATQVDEVDYGTQEFKDGVKKLEAAGLPVHMEDILPKPIADADNANFHYFEAVRLLFASDDPDNDYSKLLNFKSITEKLGQNRKLVEPGSLSKVEREQLVVAAIDRATKCSQSVPFLRREYTYYPAAFIKSPLEFERKQRAVAITEEKFHEAADSVLRSLKLIRILSNELGDGPGRWARLKTWFVTEDLNLILRSSELPMKVLDQLDEELALHDSFKILLKKALEARVFYIEDIRNGPALINRWSSVDQSKMLEFYEQQISLCEKPFFEVRDKFRLVKFSQKEISGWRQQEKFEPRHGEWSFHIANVRCLRILIAIEKFKQENGREPAGVLDLKFADSELINPVTGKPIIATRRKNGWWIRWDTGGYLWFDYRGHYSKLPRGCIPPEDIEAAKKK